MSSWTEYNKMPGRSVTDECSLELLKTKSCSPTINFNCIKLGSMLVATFFVHHELPGPTASDLLVSQLKDYVGNHFGRLMWLKTTLSEKER